MFAGAAYLSAGKTGTAQAVTIGQKTNTMPAKWKSTSATTLYIAFAPADAPKVAVAVVVENAGFSAAHAAPIARRIFDYVLLTNTPTSKTLVAVQKAWQQPPIGQPLKAAKWCGPHRKPAKNLQGSRRCWLS